MRDSKIQTTNSGEINFIVILRGLAVFFIFWSHIGCWLDYWNIEWLPMNLSRDLVTSPLKIIQDFGFMGVILLFLIGGFLIGHVSQFENRREFGIKRVFRIYPPFLFSILLIIIFYGLFENFSEQSINIIQLSSWEIISLFTFINYFLIPQNVINGVAWVLVIFGLFYVTVFFLLPLIKKQPKIAITIMIGFVFFINFVSKCLGDNFFLFAVSISYFPYLILGQIVYCYWKKKFDKLTVTIFSIICIIVIFQGLISVNQNFLPINNSYLISFFYSFIIFLIGLYLNNRLKINAFVRFYSKISYSFFLNNGIGLEIISILFLILGFSISLFLSFIFLTLVAYFSWKFIEQPFRSFSRKLIENKI